MESTLKPARIRWRPLAVVGVLSLVLGLMASPASAQAFTPVLYGVTPQGEGRLYTINPTTGIPSQIIGEIGFEVGGIAFDPTTGLLYGSTTNDDDFRRNALILIDQETGVGTYIGGILSDCDNAIQDLTFTNDGTLYGWTRNCGDGNQLVRINKATGLGTIVGPAGGLPGVSGEGNGLAVDPDDNTMWLTPDRDNGDYFTIDPATGAETNQGTLDGPANEPIRGLAWSCDGETLYGTTRQEMLITIDTATDHVTEIGFGARDQHGIAWDCTPPPAEAPTVFCKGVPATIVGTEGPDVIEGTAGDDVIVALGGDDVINSGAGDDLICAGGGRDRVRSGSGGDRVFGQGGNDRLLGQGGPDIVVGGGGNDTVKGGSGNDTVKGNAGNDNVRGQGGKDRLLGGPGDDVLSGGAGDDVLKGQAGDDNLNGGPDTDTCRQGPGTGIIKNCEK